MVIRLYFSVIIERISDINPYLEVHYPLLPFVSMTEIFVIIELNLFLEFWHGLIEPQ